MRRSIVAAVLVAAALVAAGSAAVASGYDDFMRGNEARRAGNADLALTGFTAALAAGDLAVTYQPDAHLGRAGILVRRHRCDEAIADLDAALGLRPDMLEALITRAEAKVCLGRSEAALADLDAAVALSPDTRLYAERAEFQWYRGAFAAAAADYLTAAQRQPKPSHTPQAGVFALLGYAISSARTKSFDPAAFAAAAHDLPDDDWPGVLLTFIAGKAAAAEVYRDAARDENQAAGRKCVADFYIGEWQAANGDPAGKPLLAAMAQTCPKNADVVRRARRDLPRLP